MGFSIDRRLVLLALPVLAACSSVEGTSAPVATDAYAGKGVLDAAINAAGGEAALSRVKELNWTAAGTVNAGGKTTEVEMQTIVRPFNYARTTSWPKADAKAVRMIQIEYGKAWSVARQSWDPMPEAQSEHEVQQYALYGVMLLTSLKDPAAKVQETAPGKDGTRNLHVERPGAPPMDLRFDASGKLIRAANNVRDPAGGAAPIAQVAEFSGEIESNGVKWPKRISITQNDQPYFDMDISKFEARASNSITAMPQSLAQQGAKPPADDEDEPQ
ncbi:MAG: hypothetical protein Q8R02_22990 [Hyphomonadaceae bacterium]|nr:hypothetical protein [Hyphomonadaceae bacterium]